jgi:XrtJ-associated TM-motif-TM protein
MFHGQTARIETPAKRLRVAAEMGSPMKKTFLLTALAIALIAAAPARAQGPGQGPGLGGCSDTPENPTLILAGLASGVFAASNVRTRILARRAPKQK